MDALHAALETNRNVTLFVAREALRAYKRAKSHRFMRVGAHLFDAMNSLGILAPIFDGGRCGRERDVEDMWGDDAIECYLSTPALNEIERLVGDTL